MNRPDTGNRMSDVQTVELESFPAVALHRTGPYWKLSGPLDELRQFLADHALDPSGPPVGVFYDDPDKIAPEETRFTLAYPVEEDTAARAQSLEEEAAPGFEVIRLPAVTALALEFQGNAKDSGRAYAALDAHANSAGLKAIESPREVYLAEPGTLPAGQIHLLIQLPVAPGER